MPGLPPGFPPDLDIWQTPSKAPPPGVIPDFTKRSPLMDFTIAVSAVFLPLMHLALWSRVYMRVSRRERWMSDDTVAVLTAISCTAFSGVILSTAQKLARHSWDVPIGDVIAADTQKTMVAQHVFNSLSLWLGKCCLLTMYYRFFGHIPKVKKQIIATAILTIPLFSAIIVQPILVGPEPGQPWGTPNPQVEKAVIPNVMVGIDSLLVDICIAFIPIPVISRLNLSKRKKNGIVALFATGSIAVITDIVTLYFRIKVYQREDQLLYGYVAHNCSLIESAISVILSSLPTMAGLWRVYIEPSSFFQTLRSRISQTRSSASKSSSHQSLPSYMEREQRHKKVRDPYSVGMPTATSLSQTHLSGDVEGGLELTQPKHGLVKAQITAEVGDVDVKSGDIYRRVSVEQLSIVYPESVTRKEESDLLKR